MGSANVVVLETSRLVVRHLDIDDAPFILELVNDPDWLRYIGDRGVHSLEDARRYLREGPIAMYARVGYGLFGVQVKSGDGLAGICGLLMRDDLDAPDLGFAFLPSFRGAGYARESARAVLGYGRGSLGLGRILAVVSPGNRTSIRLLESLGMRFDRECSLGADNPVLVYELP